MIARQMVGGISPHLEEHVETPYCKYKGCQAVDPNLVDCVDDAEEDTPSYDPPPKHYDGGVIDAWAVWDAFDLDRYTANAVKYLLRAGKKDIAPRLDDLVKARNYINKAIELEEKREG